MIIVGLRVYAIQKYVPYLLGKEDTMTFLTKYSARLPGTFIDSDNYIQEMIPPNSKILVSSLHNRYYFPRDFDHTSWVKSWNGYDYLVTTNQDAGQINGKLIHVNEIGIQVFKLNQ